MDDKTKTVLLTPLQVADMLAISPHTLTKSRTSGVLLRRESPKYIRLSHKKVAYKSETIEKWINALEEVS